MKVKAGTEEHKEIFCRQFLETHKPFTPEELDWPDLNEETIEKLKGFPTSCNSKLIVFNKLRFSKNFLSLFSPILLATFIVPILDDLIKISFKLKVFGISSCSFIVNLEH